MSLGKVIRNLREGMEWVGLGVTRYSQWREEEEERGEGQTHTGQKIGG